MNPTKWLSALLLVILLGAGATLAVNAYHERRAEQATTEATTLKGEIHVLKQQAIGTLATADALASQAESAKTQAAALKAKLAKLNAAPAHANPVSAVGAVDVGSGDPVGLRDEIIAAQDVVIAKQDGEITALRATLDLTGRALAASEQRARGLEIANDALKHAAKSGKWIGRFQGLAVGLAAGYVGGRLR
jgi:hypothetical protein